MNDAELRALFPLTNDTVYLNNAAASPFNSRSRQRLNEHLAVAVQSPDGLPSVRRPVRNHLSALLGGAPDDYALLTSTGVGIGMVSAGFRWQDGDNIVVPADEHWNNTFPWLALKARGIDVRLAPVDSDQRVNPDKVAALVDDRTRILASAAVRFNTGFRADLKQLSRIAHAVDALFVVDGIQCAGVVPVNVEEDGIDVFASAGFKWLLGLPGTGFLYTNQHARDRIDPVMPGMFAAGDNLRKLDLRPDGRRFETGSIAYSLFDAWIAGLELLQEVGIETIYQRVLRLTDQLISGLRSKIFEIASPVEKLSERSAIISFSVGSVETNTALHQRLLQQGIHTALRDGRIRISPNFFNNEEDINRFMEAL